MRRTLSLNGQWDFRADLDPKYHAVHRGYHQPERSRRSWNKVPVPGTWQKYAERYDIYEGVCWFAREFDAGEVPEGARARLHFGGVNYLCRVYLNGEEVGAHEGGYTAFALDVGARLRPGRNHIAVMVDNRATTIKWPPCLGYFNYGGIHRDVRLEILDGPGLEDLRLEALPAENGWELSVRGSAAGARPGDLLRVRSGEGLSCEYLPGEAGRLEVRVPFPDTPAWSPENPHLEPVAVELLDAARGVLDRRDYRFGFRTLAVRDGGVQLNGHRCPLKGICYVYDSPVHGLRMDREQLETDLSLMKEAGCNAVRCHYPMDELFYELCDRIGLLVWIEPPVYCYHPRDDQTGTSFTDPEWIALAEQAVREMIAVARNHPCAAIYGIGNECNTRNPEAESFFAQLAACVRAEDPARLVSYAALYGLVGPLAGMVDVLGINSYYGWYDKIGGGKGVQPDGRGGDDLDVEVEPIDLTPMRAMIEKVLAEKSDLVLLLTEFGADSEPGYRARGRDLWSEEYHADLLREVFALSREYPQIAGTFPFCFSDYRDPSKLANEHWDELNLKGLVSYDRRRKLAFEAVRGAYSG
jgi:beta-glucuronidase